jgi:phosphatidylinositol alpha-1,6-mannosyltransferase
MGDAYVERVKTRIQELHMDDVVMLHGNVSGNVLHDAYARASLFLMPAKTTENSFEGFGIVYLEAAAHGVPGIGPREGGAAEAIIEGKTGYHVDPSNATEISERISWILEERRIEPSSCRSFAEAHSIDRMTLQTIAVYTSLL